MLPYGRQQIDDEDIEAVIHTLRSPWLTTGPAVNAFERALAEQTTAADAVACANGTAGLHLAVLALGLGPGDVAIVPSITFVATANVVRHVGAEVAFADVDPETGLMSPAHVEEATNRLTDQKVRLVAPVHLGGQCEDSGALAALADKHGFAIIEDAAHAIGTTYSPKETPIGGCQHSDMAVFSFHPVKTITMGEGGAVTTNSPQFAERLRLLRNHGLSRDANQFVQEELAFAADGSPNPWHYEMSEIGFNYRASDIHCALGLSQLKKLSTFVERRCLLVERYEQNLAALAPRVLPAPRVPSCRPAWHLFRVRIDFDQIERDRKEVMRALQERGVGSQVHYIPVHHHPYYRERYGNVSLPGADNYFAQTLSLPLFPEMEERDVDHVVEALSEVV